MSNKAVIYQKENQVAIITLNRPEVYNAVNDELLNGLSQSLKTARDDQDIRAILITGNGKGFCSGADLSTFTEGVSPEDGRDYIIRNYGGLMRDMQMMKKPIVGALNGSAAGVGCAIALACDLRIMADTANFRYAFINIGLGPDGGAGWFLARTVGYSRAFEIAIEGDKIPAERCLELGLTNKVVPAAEVLEAGKSWATKLAERPTLAVGITKMDLNFSMNNSLQDTIAFEAEGQMRAFQSHDLKEGVMAFLQKRKPEFKGK